MFSLTYVSSALQPFTPRELRDLLDRCNENNRRRGVTGMLLYKNCSFMQVLEGEKNVVLAVHETIARDPRHRAINTLLRGEIGGRQFANWSMGFKDLGADIDNPEGYTEFLNIALTGEEFRREPTKAQQFLLSFRTAAGN